MENNEIVKETLDILYLVGTNLLCTKNYFFKNDSLQIKYEEEDHPIGILTIEVYHAPSSDYVEIFRVRISGWMHQLEPKILFVFVDRVGCTLWTSLLSGIKSSPEYKEAFNKHFSILANY